MVISEQFLTATTPATGGRQWCSPAQLWEQLQLHQCRGQGINCSWPWSTSSVHLPCCIPSQLLQLQQVKVATGVVQRKQTAEFLQYHICTVLLQCLSYERAWNHFIKVVPNLHLRKSKAAAECDPGKEQMFLQVTHTTFTTHMQQCLTQKALGGSPRVQLHCTKVQTSY